ncbi:MAG TPA: metallopeptidase TldD-related protein [Bryobacteraceae bacterium]|jgi:TldD protein|nr:metallopeptidase TldD-related protein [Bryobacteraceae bacterium]
MTLFNSIPARLLALTVLLAASATLLLPQKPDSDDVILRAMRDELDRSRELRIVGGGDDAPYYLSYYLTDTREFQLAAVLGSPIAVNRLHFRSPQVEIRVGSYDFDDTGHIFSGRFTGGRFDSNFPLDDNYMALRDALWLATDTAYKTAIESMSRKRAALNSAAAQTEKLPDFAHAEPVKNLGKIPLRKLDEAAWTARVAKLSSVFGAFPEVIASGLDFQNLDGVTYLLTNEGTAIRYDDSLAWLYARAEGQTPDGMMIRDAVSFQALDFTRLPPEAELRQRVNALGENVRALTHAPLGESSSGPTLFEPGAAAQLLAQLLGDNLRATRKPLAEPGRNVNFNPSELETKIGSRILPEWMDVVDDPTQTVWQGKPLAGFYQFDLEGVPGKPVPVVEKGVLKSLLTTRQPVKSSAASNGHARLAGNYGSRGAGISNLLVKTSQTDSVADLKKKLIDLCKERNKPYGMLVRKLDFPFSAGRSELQALVQSGPQSGGSVRPISPPVLVYRVYADGREELVRGLRFRGVSTRSLRDIVAASKESALFDYVNNGAPLSMLGAGGLLAPASVVAPALLFEEIEFEVPQEQLPKLPVVPPPSSGSSN